MIRPCKIIPALVVVAAVFAVYAQTLQNGFVYDDNHIILANEWIRDLARIPDILTSSTIFADPARSASNTYRPLLFLVFMAEQFVFGLESPWGFHLVNVSLLALNGCLLYGIASMLFAKDEEGHASGYGFLPPLLASLVFTLHTINSEAANWASAQAELLFTALFLAAFWIYTKGGREAVGRVAVSVLVYFLALLVKETAIILPALLFAFDLIHDGRRIFKRAFNYAIFFGAAVVYMAIRTYAVGGVIQHRQAPLTGVELVINIFPLVFQYAWKLVYPTGLSALYELHAIKSFDLNAAAGIAVTAAFVAAFVVFRRRRAVFLGLIMMGLPLLPVLYIPALSTSASADRYMYLPTAGFGIIVGCIVEAVFRGKLKAAFSVAIIAVMIAVTAAYAFASFERVAVWRDDFALWSDTVRKSPGSRYAHYNLALAYQDRGDLDNAIVEFKAAIKAAPGYEDAHYNLAWCYQSKGDSINAAVHYREVLRLDPGSADAHYNLGLIYRGESFFDEAAFEFREALRLKPGYAEATGALAEIPGAIGGVTAR
ncbi:MAG: tetratricopeptide repeat protein [Deltaproteobacteria bacterium]|nr:tetratricopeptide repeat protein [Deltaproteobacteria bacterium]